MFCTSPTVQLACLTARRGLCKIFVLPEPICHRNSRKITVLLGEFSLYRKKLPGDPVLGNIRGLETQFFSIGTFDTQISNFLYEFPSKVALLIEFFCIGPAGMAPHLISKAATLTN